MTQDVDIVALYFNNTQSTQQFIFIMEEVIVLYCVQNDKCVILCTGKH